VADVLQYRPQVDPLALPKGPGASGGAPPVPDYGKPLESIARSVETVAHGYVRDVKDREASDAQFYASTQLAGARGDANRILQEHADNATGEAAGFTPGYLDALDEAFKPRLEAAPSPLAKRKLEAELGALKASMSDNAIGFESKARVADRAGRLDLARESFKNAVFDDPNQLAGATRNWADAVDHAGLPPAMVAKAKEHGLQEMTQAHWLGRGLDDPRGTLAALEAGPPADLRYEDNVALRSRLKAQIKAEDAEAERARKQAAAEAKALAGQQRAFDRATLGQRMQGELDMRADGKPVRLPITDEDFKAAYDAKGWQKPWAMYQDQVRAQDAVGSMRTMSFPEQEAELAKLAPTADDPEQYGNQRDAFAAAQKAAVSIRSAYHEDPAGYVQSQVPAVRQAFVAAREDPTKLGLAIKLSMENQERIDPGGEHRPLPKEEAASVATRFKAAPTVDARLQLVAPYAVDIKDDEVGRKVLDQLEAAGLPAGADRALDAWRGAETERAREIMGGLTADPGKLPQLGDDNAKAVKKAVARLYQTPSLGAAEAQGYVLTGQPGDARTGQRGALLVEKLALTYAAGGLDATAAAERAHRVVYGSGVVTTDPALGIVRLPPGQRDVPAFEAGLAALRGQVDLSHLAPTRGQVAALLERHLGRAPLAGEVEGALQQATFDHQAFEADVRAYSRWSGAPGGYQLVLPSGLAVPEPPTEPTRDELMSAVEHVTGRPVLRNPDGSYATMEQITVTEPAINGGKPTNIPTIWDGKRVGEDEAIRRAAEAIKGGAKAGTFVDFRSYETIDQAVAAAKAASAAIEPAALAYLGQRPGKPRVYTDHDVLRAGATAPPAIPIDPVLP
jgi:hypothetical protein